MIKFDKNAPGRGVSAQCSLENGKVVLEWQIAVSEDSVSEMRISAETKQILHIRLRDSLGNVALECIQDWDEEEPLQSVLLQPHLWTSVNNPYLYRLEAMLEDGKGNCLDWMTRQFPLRCVELRRMPGEDVEKLFLNGELFIPRAVKYELPVAAAKEQEGTIQGTDAAEFDSGISGELKQIAELGANCISLSKLGEASSFIMDFCERNGLLVMAYTPGKLSVGEMVFDVEKDRILEEYVGKSPAFCGGEDALFVQEKPLAEKCNEVTPTICYYRYKACWGKVPFVYIWPESLKRMQSGNYVVTCYSNCKRLALYTDGKLFEFQHGNESFTFQEIPVKGPCITLSVEGEGCSTSLSVHKTFTKLSPIGDK